MYSMKICTLKGRRGRLLKIWSRSGTGCPSLSTPPPALYSTCTVLLVQDGEHTDGPGIDGPDLHSGLGAHPSLILLLFYSVQLQYSLFRMKNTLKGRVSKDLIHAVDWVPTLLALSGANKNYTGLDGIDQSLHLVAGIIYSRNGKSKNFRWLCELTCQKPQTKIELFKSRLGYRWALQTARKLIYSTIICL